jgi:short-subunit dehydrogenase
MQIPMLESTSSSPSICQISSIASLIPAPTRSLYGSTKAASFVLYRSLSIEHPRIRFSIVCPATVEGDFRSSAVDSGHVRESLKGALKAEYVAQECMNALDHGTNLVLLPKVYWLINLLSWIFPGAVERGARKKYNFQIE